MNKKRKSLKLDSARAQLSIFLVSLTTQQSSLRILMPYVGPTIKVQLKFTTQKKNKLCVPFKINSQRKKKETLWEYFSVLLLM